MAQGRVLMHKPDSETTQGRNGERLIMIGSRPPRCDKNCVAIQVPIVPSIKKTSTAQYLSTQYSRGDDISNYKPICWKCKCGNFIFDP
ncbi:Hypothetical predicted protein [Olea europaea subsp. europaea]|uniref:Epidermal patterning factor-like protein n=1 Tax=Olea europaea subsp. europaea TaxID=158383 RepID=A0A8S0Q8W5_OLEEU|nr:Hypothetical predicted protein [Olea europaea subsp. europaea]